MKKLLIAHTEKGKFTLDHLSDDRPSLTHLQRAVDGYIEVAHIPSLDAVGVVLIVNEEGVLYGLPINENLEPFFFVGNVVFVSVNGEELEGLNNAQLYFVNKWMEGLRI